MGWVDSLTDPLAASSADGSFMRANHAREGLGLGLAITRHLVEMHGGTIEAISAGPEQGATFTVTLPLKRAGAA